MGPDCLSIVYKVNLGLLGFYLVDLLIDFYFTVHWVRPRT